MSQPLPSGDAAKEQRISAVHLSVLFGSTMAYVGIALPFFPVMLAGKGLSEQDVSLIIAVSLISRLLGNPVVTAIADRWSGIARALAVCTVLAAFLTALLVAADGFWQIAVLVALMSLAQGSLMPLSDAIVMGEIKRRAEAHEASLDYGRIRVWGSGTVFAVMLIGGSLIELIPGEGIAILLAVATLAPVLPAMALARRNIASPRDTHVQENPDRPHAWTPIVVLILSAGLVQASHAMYYSFSSLHWKATGLSTTFTGTAWALGVLCEIVFFIVAGKLFGGERNAIAFLIVGAIGCIVRWAAMTSDPGPAMILGLQTLHALTFASTHLGSVFLLSRLAGPAFRAQAQGWMAAATSCGLTVSTIAIGQSYAQIGEQAYWIMVGMASAGLFGFIVISRILRHDR
jgi:PPP family 3-phenylpropionic acid transporter